MDFHDFEIRAWIVDQAHVAVVVHSSPAGAMQRPELVPFDLGSLRSFQKLFMTSSRSSEDIVSDEDINRVLNRDKLDKTAIAERLDFGGRGLANILFPEPVLGMLIRSLERIDWGCGLRVRLCLDSELSNLPWEYLILPKMAGLKAPRGFLALDARISVVREAPQPGRERPRLQRKQRLLFFGTRCCSPDGEDQYETARERNALFDALKPAGSFLKTQAALSNETDCQSALMSAKIPIDIFHYSGHADVENGNGYLEARDMDPTGRKNQRLYASSLGPLLHNARTTIAVFSACNSGNWAFVGPLLESGLPVVVAAQGNVYVDVAIMFCQQLYSALALGLSLDEAVTWARHHLLEPGVLDEELQWQWGIFKVHMQTPEAVLFPRPRVQKVAAQQNAARQARAQTIINVTQHIVDVHGGEVIGVSAETIGALTQLGSADVRMAKVDR